MADRDKHEAQTRLAIGTTRVLMQQGRDGRESLEAMKEHFAIVDSLETETPHLKDESADIKQEIALKQS